jgi:hypothetical protein
MPWSLTQIQDFVRAHADVDTEDLPPSVLARFIEDGFNRVFNEIRANDWYEEDLSLQSVVGTQSYTLRPLSGSTNLRQVASVRGDKWLLEPAQHRTQRDLYRLNSANPQEPTEFSIWGSNLYLWPIPDAVYTYSVNGWREPTDWITASTNVDAPERFHELVAWWALNRTYIQQDDPELADFYRSEFMNELKQRSHAASETNAPSPQYMGKDRNAQRFLRRNGLGRLWYEWE